MIKYNTRFAPSPNGYLHLGHAYSALISSELAKKSGGKFFIRIEDIDLGRCKKEFEEKAKNDMLEGLRGDIKLGVDFVTG